MPHHSILNLSILQLQRGLRDDSFSCVDVVQAYLAQIDSEASRPYRLNAITCLNPQLLEQAAQLDERRRQGRPMGLLHGVPILVKDNIDVAGLPTSNGSRLLARAMPNANAAIIHNILAEDALIVGKASMGEFAQGNYSSRDGTVRNPFHPARSPAGSSCGSAVAVAARFALAAIGTDSSNSVRGPAAMAGIVGLRPTTRLLDRAGIAPKSRAFDTAGPMARSIEDATLLLEAMRGGEMTGVRTGLPGRRALRNARFGVVGNFFKGDPEVLAMVGAVLTVLETLGVTLVDIEIDDGFVEKFINDSSRIVRSPADACFEEDFNAYLGGLVDDGIPRSVAEIVAGYEAGPSAGERAVEDVTLDFLRHSLGRSSKDDDYRECVEMILPVLTAFKRDLFDSHDLDALVYPTKAAFAAPLDTPEVRIEDRTYVAAPVPWENPLVMASYDCVGNPDVTLPLGLGRDGMPAALSIMGRPHADAQILSYAAEVERSLAVSFTPRWLTGVRSGGIL